MINLGLKSTFPRLCNTVVKKRELIIEGVHNDIFFLFSPYYFINDIRI